MILAVPDVRQTEGHRCGEAALEAVARFYGVSLPALSLANRVQGLNPDTLEAAGWQPPFGRVCRGSMDVAALKHWTRQGRPVLCPITDPVLSGHWVVVCGVERNKIHLHCPVVGPKAMSLGDWESVWHDSAAGREYVRFGLVVWPGE